jgi:hypothetical protein
MPFTPQNDLGTVAGANCYVTLEFFQSYCADRNLSLDNYEEAAQQAAGINVTAMIDSSLWKGERLVEDQTTEFPRSCLYDRAGRLMEGLFTKLKHATCEYMYFALQNGGSLYVNPVISTNGMIATSESKKIGPLEKSTTYMATAPRTRRPCPSGDNLLKEFRLYASSGVIR